MAYAWTTNKTATLKVRKANSTNEYFVFTGVATDNSAGTPDTFLAAANHLLDIAGQVGVISGMSRSLEQGVSN